MPFIASIGGSILGGLLGSGSAKKAADTQSQAAMYAADLQKKAADESLAFQKDQWNTTQKNLQPWLTSGSGAVSQLSDLMQPGGMLYNTPQFKAPTMQDAQNDPGFQFQMQQGLKALQSSAAAKGNLFSGGTLKALNRYGQDYSATRYNDVYNRALNEYGLDLNNRNTLYNRLAGLAGTGQTAATNLGSFGNQAANAATNTLMTSAANMGQQYNNAAAARASGYVGSANAWQPAISNLSQLPLMWAQMNG